MSFAPGAVTGRVADHIRQNCAGFFGEAPAAVRPSGFEDVDYWSIINTYEVHTRRGGRHTVYCKLPKSRWGLCAAEDLGQDPAAPEMAAVEFSSLRLLWEAFKDAEPSLKVIRALDLLTQPSAILSEGLEGCTEVYQRLRQADRRAAERPAALDLVRKCGRWLAHLHGRGRAWDGLCRLPGYTEQLEGTRAAVEALRRGRNFGPIAAYFDAARRLPVEEDEQDLVCTAEGFEVRNFIAAGGTIYFLDPGRLCLGSRYEDLARFLASLAILHWGRLRLLWKSATEDLYARAFLEGYGERLGPLRPGLLGAYLVKRYLRLWLEGLEVLEFKRHPAPLKWIGRRLYLPAFFRRRLDAELARLRG